MANIDTKFNRPKGFGEILDLTFSLSKSRFRDFFTIALIFMGPIYLLQSLILLVSGKKFFREVGVGGAWYEQFISGYADPEMINFGADLAAQLMIMFLGFISLFIIPVAMAAILLAANHIRKNETYTIGSVIKKAFSRYGAILGGTILFVLIAVALNVVPYIIVFIMTIFIMAVSQSTASVIISIILFILLLLGLTVGIFYLLTRWSFYFGSVVLGEEVPGLSRSWRLTKKRTWSLLGIYIILGLLMFVINLAVELSLGLLLGNSVLLVMIGSLVSIVTTVIFTVGYSVMYLDLKVRHDADDIKDLIQDYNVAQ